MRLCHETPFRIPPYNNLRYPWPDGTPSEETSCHQVGEHHPDEECPGRDAMAVSPAKIAAMVLLGALMALYVLLTSGCAQVWAKGGEHGGYYDTVENWKRYGYVKRADGLWVRP